LAVDLAGGENETGSLSRDFSVLAASMGLRFFDVQRGQRYDSSSAPDGGALFRRPPGPEHEHDLVFGLLFQSLVFQAAF
jgi:hypothetical protein